jgi:hypothetical protein
LLSDRYVATFGVDEPPFDPPRVLGLRGHRDGKRGAPIDLALANRLPPFAVGDLVVKPDADPVGLQAGGEFSDVAAVGPAVAEERVSIHGGDVTDTGKTALG